MFDPTTLVLNVDPLILGALREDINSEDVSTNSVRIGAASGGRASETAFGRK